MNSDAWGGDADMPDAQSSKRSRGEEDERPSQPNMQKLMVATAKQLMTTSFQAKTAYSILIANWFVPASHKIAIECKKAATECTKKTKGKKGHGFGIPDYWVFRALMLWMSEHVEEGAAKKIIEDMAPTCTPAGLKHKVMHCRLADTHDSSMKRLEINLSQELNLLAQVLFSMLEGQKFVRTEGKAPRSNNEREIMELLQKMGEWNAGPR